MKKTLLSLIIMCFMAVSVLLGGCSPKGLQDNPATDANVTSNGGMTVVKGDYLYYVNGYVDETTLGAFDNKYGEVYNGAIYRTKLNNGEITKDSDGFVKTADGKDATELVVPKLVGFANGGFYIIDDFIYYATPNMEVDRDGKLQSDRVEFHRININGTDDKKIYSTSENQDNLDWTVYKVGNTVYIATYVNNTLIIVNTTDNKVVAEIKDCTSYALLKEEDYHTGKALDNELHKYIYYTRAKTDADNLPVDYLGNVICKVDITTGESVRVDIANSKNYEFAIKYVNADKVYYTKKDMTIGGLALMHARNLALNTWKNSEEEDVAYDAYSNYYFCDFGDNLIIGSSSDGTFVVEGAVAKVALTTQVTILDVCDGYAYYATENKLSRFNIRGEIATEEVTNKDKTHTITNDNYIDFDNQRVYVYCDYTSASGETNTYLNYIDKNLNERFVGKFQDGHTPAEPEQDEDSQEDIPHID